MSAVLVPRRPVRIWTGWGILVGLMARTNALPGMLMALLAVPLVAGCSVLGLPPAGAALDALPAAGVEGDGVPTPGAEASPTFFSSNDGYALTLPAGWVGVKTKGSASDDALDAAVGIGLDPGRRGACDPGRDGCPHEHDRRPGHRARRPTPCHPASPSS